MRTFLFFAFLISGTWSIASAQFNAQARITGQVTNEENAPVDFANVLLLNPLDSSLVKGALTEADGSYLFEEVEFGNYLISVSLIGYETLYSALFQVGETSIDIRMPALQLKNGNVQLEEVVVKAQKPFIELQSDKLVLNIESSPVSAGNNALELLAKAPGITVDQNDRISLRGKQGVLVMVNGKSSYLSMEEIVKMLETMPASSIEAIEIIQNPSAKYDATGNAGIINIRLKRNKNLGFNGGLDLGGGYGAFGKATSAVRFNYRQQKFNVFGDASYRYNKRRRFVDINRNIPFEGAVTEFDQSNGEVSWSNSTRFKTGADWFISDKTTVGVLFSARTGNWNAGNNNLTVISGDNPEPFSRVLANNEMREEWNDFSYNANLKHAFDQKGREITFDADYSSFRNDQFQDYFNYFYTEEFQELLPPNLLQSDNTSDVAIKALKADYSQPFGKNARLETGIKTSFVSTDNSILFLLQQTGEWVIDPTRTNRFVYKESIYAAYANFSKQFKGFNLQAGLRAEYTVSDGNSVTLQQQVKRDYLDLFPSLSLSHSIGEAHNLSYSYSRRIDRPTYQDLNPFLYFLDQYTFGKGNPFLQPQYTHSFSVSYGFKRAFIATASYSHTENAMSEVLEQDDATRQTFQTWANLARFDNVSLNLSAPVNLAEWWSARINFSGFFNRYRSPFALGEIRNDQLSYQANFNQNFSLPRGFKAELSGFYRSPTVWALFEVDHVYSIDAGISRTVLDGKGSLKLNVSDIFNTQVWKVTVQQNNLDVKVANINETRRFNAAFSYKFGNAEVKPARRRGTATEEEQNRVKRS